MNHSQILASVQYIRPNAQFALRGDELEWLDAQQEKPTQAEIEAGWVAYQTKLESDKTQFEAQKAALLNRLGITEAEAQLLLS